jgi:peptidoglycan/xylan/chitin deacetylase (PgdA/CDA1 family)
MPGPAVLQRPAALRGPARATPSRQANRPTPRPAPVLNPRLATTIAAGGTLALALTALGLLADSHTIQVLGTHLAALATRRRSVVLSFDDGPNPDSTPAILAALHSRGVPATFFLIGERIERYPQLAARIVAEGHQVGNHSYSHPRMVLEHPRAYAREIDRTDRLIRSLGYRGTIDFRPPYGQKLVVLPWLLARRHTLSVLWNVDSRDWIETDPDRIARRVVGQVRPGSIVLLHDLPRTAKALPQILDGLQRRGYSFRTVRAQRQPGEPPAHQAGAAAGPEGPAKRMSRLRR